MKTDLHLLLPEKMKNDNDSDNDADDGDDDNDVCVKFVQLILTKSFNKFAGKSRFKSLTEVNKKKGKQREER